MCAEGAGWILKRKKKKNETLGELDGPPSVCTPYPSEVGGREIEKEKKIKK